MAFSEIIVGSKLLKWLTTVWGRREITSNAILASWAYGPVCLVIKRKFHYYKQNCMLLSSLICSYFYKTPLQFFMKCQDQYLISTHETELILEVLCSTSLKIKWKCQSEVQSCFFLEYKYLEVIMSAFSGPEIFFK